MARLRESLIIDEISFLEEPLGGNSLLTMKNVFYGLIGILVGYKLIYSGKPAAELLGILLLAFIGFLVAYPKKSLAAESLLIGMISYYILGTGQTTKQRENLKKKAKKAEKVKGETKARRPAVPVIPNIMNILALGRKTKASKPVLTVELTRQKTRKLTIKFTLLDYIIIIIGIASGVLGAIILNKAFWSLEVEEVYVSTAMVVAGFSASIERILEKLVR